MNPYRVLIVEDHPFQHEYLLNIFKDAGCFRVESVWDGESALQCLARNHYDLLLSDLMMPCMDGVQLIQKVGAMDNPPALAVMSVASRRMLVGVGQLAKNLGLNVAGLISKPVQAIEVLRLREFLDTFIHQAKVICAGPPSYSRETLLDAMKKGDIQAWFQPKKSLRDGRIVAAEALVRWLHPSLGVLLPKDFLADIERLRLDSELMLLMLNQALSAQARWRRDGYEVPISINLPTHLLDQQDLPDRLKSAVINRDARTQDITFELMETSTTHALSNYYAGACRLRMMGFGLAQDDFGQGFSSYFTMLSTPFSELKIDRSLVHGCVDNESQASALESIVKLGKKLGLTTVAEGVETASELALLRNLQCDQAQGFLIAKGVSVETFSALLRDDGPAIPKVLSA
ncbi:EAL domain, c-di-GMP-specific phosphodiesterase class I (or its enzymatically inactive variant) [Pseudomonas cuatrocienegasensis]|uniref:EAL domain, c-di-GMP-specific phosphodiesterase class I (Or its enzymatically inactive variant) n=1 Tax=Pseudomonas cuatrocienegasensis TaxID=543360 RepID=A0ABY1BPI5_9PSED|nr:MULTISPECIES: EAL domain-containing response regulator [Pseudomonas]OEC33756.1 diguanylate phosphodiesterase [Pseudomonas sp. 21C1]SER31803.1 EAL domain, c-di-GMP-specific phosphodiesterase class I (or its enzymatically inactive variant) [Pseudomonas cuatrocienegasensis]